MTITIGGYYGFGNWGDEVALAVLLRFLRERLPQARLVVLSHDPPKTERLHAVRAVSRWNPYNIHRALEEASVFVLGPGSLLQDVTSTRSLLYYLGLLRWAARLRKPVYLLGQGIGPLRSARSERWVARALQEARLILLRDSESYTWARSHEISEDRLVLGEDLALLYPYPSPAPPQRNRTVSLVLRPGLSPRHLAELCSAMRALHKKLSIQRWQLLPFHFSQDAPVLREVAHALGSSASLVRPENPEHLLHLIAESEMLIGMRLHSLVFALQTETPFYALSYDPKIERFVRRVAEIAQRSLCWRRVGDDFASALLVTEIERVFSEREQLKTQLASARIVLQARAEAALRASIARLAQEIS
ncbi:MAG: polysaccharide pyruvyl transferase CsaB [Candidatus Bipolaricaulota bacterium]|nr:polysaccharide pyruvyl transferase CsaB [Candidatus Bipolaricaulota bacterium]MDW8110638.1 polysaccharide pyruvyl transferase CsaB [Candidatus Bipolaricaulota bacterium]MDW8328504.1 polysaccharide pyruvyl transferase CsaB [Candidatus Bipolaricaulota bacterium]